MNRLLILADDFTGALDSGVQLAKTGVLTSVTTDSNIDFGAYDSKIQVLVVDTETRHLPAEKARAIVSKITARAVTAGIDIIYKKTDSALRGNIGAELEGALEGSGSRKLYFVPAFPKLGRSTCNGIHYFNGIPIHETVFGKDPFEPVQDSYVPDIIGRQSRIPVIPVKQGEEIPDTGNEKSFILFDACSDEDLADIAAYLNRTAQTGVLAGCAGFAAYLPLIFKFKRQACPAYAKTTGVLVLSGSLNPITSRQLEVARKAGFDCITLTQEQNLCGIPENEEGEAFLSEIIKRYKQKKHLIISSVCEEDAKNTVPVPLEGQSRLIAANMGKLASRFLQRELHGALAITGGDILRGVLDSLGCNVIMPLCEIETGVVLSEADTSAGKQIIISKSGGIGTDEVFIHIAEFLENPK